MQLLKIKEAGIISGYIFMLVGIYLFDYEPFILFITFLLDYFASVVILAITDYFDKSKKSSVFNFFHILITGALLGIIQTAFIMLLAYLMEGKSTFAAHQNDLYWLIPLIFIPTLILKTIPLFGENFNRDLTDRKRGEMMTHAVAFPAMLMAGILIHEIAGKNSVNLVLTFMILARCGIEFWMNHLQKPKKKK